MTVYVLFEQPHFNYQPAEAFGDVEFVLTDELSGLKDGSPRDHYRFRQIVKFAEKYNPARDFVVFTGAPNLIATAAMVLSRHHDRVVALRYSQDRYYQMTIDLKLIEQAGRDDIEP